MASSSLASPPRSAARRLHIVLHSMVYILYHVILWCIAVSLLCLGREEACLECHITPYRIALHGQEGLRDRRERRERERESVRCRRGWAPGPEAGGVAGGVGSGRPADAICHGSLHIFIHCIFTIRGRGRRGWSGWRRTASTWTAPSA